MLHDIKFSDGRATNVDKIYRRVKVSERYNWYCYPNFNLRYLISN